MGGTGAFAPLGVNLLVKYKDYYAILGVDRKATDKEIKSAYRKLARQHHPDANQNNPQAEEKFKEIGEAYEVLKDPEKRRRYDMLGSNWKAGADFRPPPDFSGGFNFDFGDLGGMGRGSPFSDFFEVLFGQALSGAAGGGAGGRAGVPPGAGRVRKGLDQEADIELSVEEIARGTTRNIQVTAPGQKTKTLEVKIPRGVRTGSRVRVSGEGGLSMDQGPRGDLYLKVKVKPHAYYQLEGDNLISELQLSPAQAVLGGEATVTTIDGPVKITVPAGTQSGRLLRLKARGLPKLKQDIRGDHLVRVKIVVPTNPTPEELKLYEELSKLEKQQSHTAAGAS